MSGLKDREEEAYIKQALYWNGYLGWLLKGSDTPALDQPAEEVMEQNFLDPAPNLAGPSAPTETTVVESPVLDKTKKRYPVVIP